MFFSRNPLIFSITSDLMITDLTERSALEIRRVSR